MREILFRGKRICGNKEWVEGCLLNLDEDSSHVFIVPFFHGASTIPICRLVEYTSVYVNPETVGQFTGKTDKNGKKIFEGDIMSERGNLFAVVYDKKWARFKLQHINRGIQYPEWNRGEQMEIVGNIHDNPELLEG